MDRLYVLSVNWLDDFISVKGSHNSVLLIWDSFLFCSSLFFDNVVAILIKFLFSSLLIVLNELNARFFNKTYTIVELGKSFKILEEFWGSCRRVIKL